MSENLMSKITLPVDINGTVTNVEFTIKDAEARHKLDTMGTALLWIGVTTTPISDGDPTNPIMVNGNPVTAVGGNMTAYNGIAYVWDADGNVWQNFATGTYGELAYKDYCQAVYTPAGSVSITEGADTTDTIIPFGTAGTVPELYFTVSNGNATLHFDAGTAATAGQSKTVVTASGTRTATFTGIQATIVSYGKENNPSP